MTFALLKPTRHDVYDFIDPMKNLKGAAAGKTVLVTGAGTGIGRGIAQSFALAGATHVYLAARRAEPLEETAAIIRPAAPSCEVTVVSGIDISSPASVTRLFSQFHNTPDVVVSNAAVSSSWETLINSDLTKWKQDIDINLLGSYYIAREYLTRLNGREGRIVNVSSNGSWRIVPGLSSYSASKVALNNLSEYIDRENEHVRCFAMHPGGVAVGSELVEQQQLPENIQKMMIDQPALPGGTAVYLGCGKADWLGGRYVMATWDMEELAGLRERVVEEDLLKTRILGVA